MLILTRKPGESLYIGDHVKITVVEIKGNQIRIGIDAPQEMRIYREEIYLQILEENKKAAATGVSDESLAGLSEAWAGRKGATNPGPAVRGLVASGTVPVAASAVKVETDPVHVMRKRRKTTKENE